MIRLNVYKLLWYIKRFLAMHKYRSEGSREVTLQLSDTQR
jgi:hypothetical protein